MSSSLASDAPTVGVETHRLSRKHSLPGAVWFVLAGSTFVLVSVTQHGADLLWATAIGDRIRNGRGVPQSVPFATAPSNGWTNPMALGEILLSLVHSMGPSALVVLHLLLVVVSLGMLVARGVGVHQREARCSLALILVILGGAATLAIARMPSLSLVPYAALVVLLLHEAENPSWRLWLSVPLLAIWGNLHGGVLVGCALLSVALIFHGGPVRRRLLIAVAALSSFFLLTSAGWRTYDYYLGVLGNESARQHSGLWARPSLHSPFDIVTMLAAVVLIVMWARSRPRRWEAVAVVGMVAATLMASRNSIWLLLFLLPIAARGCQKANAPEYQGFPLKPAATALVFLLLGVGWQLTSRGPALDAQGTDAIGTVRALAAGRTVLAIEPAAETFAQAGIRIWAGNPIDAFPRHVQQQFLTFLNDGAIPPEASISLVVVNDKLAGTIRAQGWRQVGSVDSLRLFERPRTAPAHTGGAP